MNRVSAAWGRVGAPRSIIALMSVNEPARPAGAPFQVVFHMTETGLLKVHGYEAGSGREVRFEIQIGGMDETKVRQAAAAVARYEVSG